VQHKANQTRRGPRARERLPYVAARTINTPRIAPTHTQQANRRHGARPEWKMTGRHGPWHTAGRERGGEGEGRGDGACFENPSCCPDTLLATSATRASPNMAADCTAPRSGLMCDPPDESTLGPFDHRRSQSPPPGRYLRHAPLSILPQSRAFPCPPSGQPSRRWCGVLRSICRRCTVHPGRAAPGSHQNCGNTLRRLPPWQPMVPAKGPSAAHQDAKIAEPRHRMDVRACQGGILTLEEVRVDGDAVALGNEHGGRC
jgi:hypothetical protein